MEKVGRPRGLIDYVALSDAPREAAGGAPVSAWRHILRPRNIVYFALWSLVGVALVFALFVRPEIEMTVAPVRNPTFVTLSDGSVRNAYDVRVLNKNGEERSFLLSPSLDTTVAPVAPAWASAALSTSLAASCVSSSLTGMVTAAAPTAIAVTCTSGTWIRRRSASDCAAISAAAATAAAA